MKNFSSLRRFFWALPSGSLMQKNSIFRAKITQNHPGGQKMRFFKVRDIDTIIEPGEKEHQTDVSSALKRFGDHPCRF